MTFAERAAALISSGDYMDPATQDAHLALVNERLDAEGLRGKVWGAMTYTCERCGRNETREMEVGVEGPEHWRIDSTYIATAFSAGRCDCGGQMTHKHWASDIDYDEPREPTMEHVFRVPREWPIYSTQGMDDDGRVITGRANSAFLQLRILMTERRSS